jgi:hypothetical protein
MCAYVCVEVTPAIHALSYINDIPVTSFLYICSMCMMYMYAYDSLVDLHLVTPSLFLVLAHVAHLQWLLFGAHGKCLVHRERYV